MNKEEHIKIGIGDEVRVNFNNSQFSLVRVGEVLSVPCSKMDSWIILDKTDNEVHYISEPCTITKKVSPEAMSND